MAGIEKGMGTHACSTDRPPLVVAGTAAGATSAAGATVQLTVVVERVVADDADAEVIAAYCTDVIAGGEGTFTDAYVPTDDEWRDLHGWVMCTVTATPRLDGVAPSTKVVRWQRPEAAALVRGLSALLASVVVDVRQRTRR